MPPLNPQLSEDPSSPLFNPAWADPRLAGAPLLIPSDSQKLTTEGSQANIRLKSDFQYRNNSIPPTGSQLLKLHISEKNSEVQRVSPPISDDFINQ